MATTITESTWDVPSADDVSLGVEVRPDASTSTEHKTDSVHVTDLDLAPPARGAPTPPSPRVRQASIFGSFPNFSIPDALPFGALTNRSARDDQEDMGNPAQKRALVSRPTCTHISMVKIYFDRKLNPTRCTQCGRVPSIGFVYSCEQDKVFPQQRLSVTNGQANGTVSSSKKSKKVSKDKGRPSFSSTPMDMSYLSPSLISGIKTGHYTAEQVDKLIQQKEHMLNVVTQVQAEVSEEPRFKNGSSTKIFAEKLGIVDEEGKKPVIPSVLSSKSRRVSMSKSLAPCDYKVCHTCRPNSREKTFMSLGSVLNGEVAAIESWCAQTMPVISIYVARNLGLRKAPKQLNGHHNTTEDGFEPMMAGALNSSAGTYHSTTWSLNLQPRPSVEGFRQGLRRSLIELLRVRLGSPSPASAPPSVDTSLTNTPRDSAYNSTESTPIAEDSNDTHLTVPSPEQSNTLNRQINVLSDMCTTEIGEFNVELWRKMSDEVLAQAAALQLSDAPIHEDGDVQTEYQDLAKHGDLGTMKHEGMLKEQEILEEKLQKLKEGVDDQNGEHGLDASSFGGLGLRLTEEAAETNSPDVIVKSE